MKNQFLRIAYSLLILGTCTIQLSAQNGWVQIPATGQPNKFGTSAFAVGKYIYRTVGSSAPVTYETDTWKYDPIAKTWTQLPSVAYPGNNREGTSTFSIGDTAYIVTGGNGGGSTVEVWQFDPVTPKWTQMANFPGAARSYAAAFSIGKYGYAGCGATYSGTSYADFYRFDPYTGAKGTWTPVTSFPGTARWRGASFSLGNKGYFGLGCPSSTGASENDFYEFDPTGNAGSGSWKTLTAFPGAGRSLPSVFVLCNKGYIIMGAGGIGLTVLKDFWMFDPTTGALGSWSRMPDFPHLPVPDRFSAQGFAIGDSAYIAGGIDINSNTTHHDLWMYTPSVKAAPSSVAICSGAGTTLMASGNSVYNWAPAATLSSATTGSGLIPGDDSTTTASPLSLTTYTVTDRVCGLQDTVQVNVTTPPVLVISASVNPICAGSLSALTTTGANTYSWAPNTGLTNTTGANINAQPTSTVTYTVTGNGSGCPGKGTYTLNVNPLPIITTNSPVSICPGGSVTVTASGATNYTWSPSIGLSANTGNSLDASPKVPTNYTIMGTDGNGCTGVGSLAVNINIPPVVEAGPDISINAGDSKILSGSGGTSYTWSPSTGLSCTNCQSPTANPMVTTSYYLTAMDANGCTNTDTITVDVIYKGAFIPTAFSPNGDGKNDVVFVRGNEFKLFTLSIFNRWGQKVFETTDAAKGWDGTFNGKLLDPGVFVYYFKGTSYSNEQINKKGNISLIR